MSQYYTVCFTIKYFLRQKAVLGVYTPGAHPGRLYDNQRQNRQQPGPTKHMISHVLLCIFLAYIVCQRCWYKFCISQFSYVRDFLLNFLKTVHFCMKHALIRKTIKNIRSLQNVSVFMCSVILKCSLQLYQWVFHRLNPTFWIQTCKC